MLISFKDHPEFTPNLTPRQIFEYGSFGGSYFRDLEDPNHSGTNALTSLPPDLWQGIDKDLMLSAVANKQLNKYKVNAGTSLEDWRHKNWIKKSLTLMVGYNGIAIFIMGAGQKMILVKYKDG